MKRTIMVVSVTEGCLGWTYPKRAKGLIKKGRAFWLPGGENKVLVLKHEEDEDKENQNERSTKI